MQVSNKSAGTREVNGVPELTNDIIESLLPVLKGLASVCIEQGILSPMMEHLMRRAFVEVAAEKLKQSKSPQRSVTDLRIALVTGIHRNQVRAVKRTDAREIFEADAKRFAGTALLEAWATEPQYVSTDGRPRDLPVDASIGKASFRALVQRYLPAWSVAMALEEFIRLGAISMTEDQRVRLRSRSIQISRDGLDCIRKFANVLGPIVQSIAEDINRSEPTMVLVSKPVKDVPRRRLNALWRKYESDNIDRLEQMRVVLSRVTDKQAADEIGGMRLYLVAAHVTAPTRT